MEHKNDIGDLIKDWLNKEAKAPKQDLWDRINTSLDEHDRNRRKIAWYTYGGSAIFALLIISIFTFIADTTPVEILEKKLKTEHVSAIDNKPANINKENEIKSISNDTIISTPKINTDTLESTTFSSYQKNSVDHTVIVRNPSQIVRENKNKEDEQFNATKMSTTYTHYLSELDSTFVSQNKQDLKKKVAAARRKLFIKDSLNKLK